MRTFNGICTWLYWFAILYFWAGTIFIWAVDSGRLAAGKPTIVAHQPEYIASTRQIHGIALAVTGVVTIIMYALRRRFWFRPRRAAGFGYWVMTLLLYICVFLTVGNGIAPFFVAGERGIFLMIGLAAGLAFIILCVPKLPIATPPPVPG